MNTSMHADLRAAFLAAEHEGIKLALKGRFVAIGAFALWYGLTRTGRELEVLVVAGALVVLGVVHFMLAGSRHDRPWIKYLFITVDVILLTIAITLTPEIERLGLPHSIIFRFDLFPFYFLVLVVAAFSFSPGMVLWAGFAGAAAWLSAFTWIAGKMEHRLGWSDVPRNQDAQAYLDVFLSPDFAAPGGRLQEALVLMMVAGLLAIVMHRTRETVFMHLQADSERKAIASVFGRYVPQTIVDAMVEKGGSLAPVHREATVLFVDLAGFTRLTERVGPQRIVDLLNEYFDAVTQVIGRHNGVVTQFQGDAVLATFNVPVSDERHARQAFDAAREILALVAARAFSGEQLHVRIGINTGPLVAGNVGGGGRQTYTVHGDAVNLAARLEAMNKEHDTHVLISETTAALLDQAPLRKVASVEVRGLTGARPVYTLAAKMPRG